MTTEQQRSAERASEEEVVVLTADDVAAAPPLPAPPAQLSAEETRELEVRAAGLARQLDEATGSRGLEVADGLASLGVQAQRRAGTELDLLRGQMRHILTSDGPSAELWDDLREMRTALERIDPEELGRPTVGRRFRGALARVRHSTPGAKTIERIAIRHETVSRQVATIERRLREGRAMLLRDNVELRKLYEQVEEQQLAVQKNAYLGELLLRELAAVLERAEDPRKAERLRSALHDVAMRVQDLRTMEEVQRQFFVSIEMTRENNARLGQGVERTLALGTHVVTVGLAIQMALAREQRVLEATRRTREFVGELVAANAASIKRHTVEIGDVYNAPVVAIEKVAQAHNDLIEAIDLASQLKEEGVASARETIARLGEMTAQLERREPLALPAGEASVAEA